MKSFKTSMSGVVLSLAFGLSSAGAAIPAHPGMLNYVEGQTRINGRIVTPGSIGTVDVAEGQVIETTSGKAEVLLTPGVFLRLGDNSAVRMDGTSLIDTRVAILNGRALIEADDLQKANNIRVLDGAATSRLEKNGIYTFTANLVKVATIDGKQQVTEGDQTVEVGKGHEVTPATPLRANKFDRHADENDPLYQWSKLRSQYLAEASVQQSRAFLVNNAGWYGNGWYWNPWFSMYSWIPGDGMFLGPFGWGFYSPFTVWQAPVFYRGGFRGGYRGGIYTAPRVRVPAFHGGGAIGRRR